MGMIIDFEFRYCPHCGHRRTIRNMQYLEDKHPCPKCDQGMAGSFNLFTSNPDKYKLEAKGV